MGVRQSFSAFWSLETSENSSDTSQVLTREIDWMVGGTGEVSMDWKKARVVRKGRGECFTSVTG